MSKFVDDFFLIFYKKDVILYNIIMSYKPSYFIVAYRNLFFSKRVVFLKNCFYFVLNIFQNHIYYYKKNI